MYNFEAVIGNEHIVNALQGTIEQGRVNHAICITGKPGTGRKLISRAYAKALQCETGQNVMQIAMPDTVQDADSCGVCASCVSFDGGTHPDIFQIRPEKSSIGVDVVREQIVAEIAHRPHRYPYKVFIIEESQTLTVQAQNA
ncbi:MAG: DNA polymerase III subunit delta, partial [Defluviitaleaceae bacterium]|nr:DNA polymerase III subunit delta [Defluviitaleaceae bacterium]